MNTKLLASRKAVMAGAGGMALTALGYRAWDRGVFAGATGPAYTLMGRVARQRLSTASEGRSARPCSRPVPHNTQPWQFEESNEAITVYADRSRHLGSFDPFRREMHLGLGCAIENFALAARTFGLAADVHVANGRFEVSPGSQPVRAAQMMPRRTRRSDDPLCRRDSHAPDQPRTLPRSNQLRPSACASSSNSRSSSPSSVVRVVFLSDDVARREVGALIVEATERIVADHEMSLDSFRWIRTGRRDVLAHRDGVTIDTAGAGRLKTLAAKFLPNPNAAVIDRIWLDATRATQTATAAVFGMMLVPDRLDMASTIAAGRAWQRLHLAATILGLAAQPLNQPVEMIDRNQMLGRAGRVRSGAGIVLR